MAVAIDTTWMAQVTIPAAQRDLDRIAGDVGRFRIHRVCAHATVLPDHSTLGRQLDAWLDSPRGLDFRQLVKQEALDWQADADDDLDELEVLHHLQQQAATIPFLSKVISQSDRTNAATTLVASVLSPSFSAWTHGRHLSSFNRYSLRVTSLFTSKNKIGTVSFSGQTNAARVVHTVRERKCISELVWPSENRIVWARPKRVDHLVYWQVEVDVVDLFSEKAHPTSRPGKRRRTAFNPFLQVSDSALLEDNSRGNHLPYAKRYNGVRHRPDRKTWVAEMKPPKHKNKEDFGNFKSAAQAARAVDAAFHHYGKPHLLNFPDSSAQFLSTRPSAAAGLDEKAKLRFVKGEAKWLVSIATDSPLRSPAPPLPVTLPEYHSSFDISLSVFSCGGGADEADDGVSHPQPVTTTGVEMNMEPNYVGTEELGVMCNLQEGQDMFMCNSEIASADPCLHPLSSGRSSVQITEQGWDGAEDSTLATLPNVVNPRGCEMQSMWLDSLIRSPPAPTYPMAPSPSHFQDEIAHALLEQQSF